MTAKLALGTVQFGAAYGIKNKTGRIPEKDAADILRRAYSEGIEVLDTSQAYGESEAVLGRIIPPLKVRFKIVSKFIAARSSTPKGVVADSMRRLSADGFYAFLYHRFSDFHDYPEWHTELQEIKAGGSFKKLGFSVYYPRELQSLIDSGVKFDIVQVPYSVFDRRFEQLFPVLKNMGVEIHVRSAFLQGAVFIKPSELPTALVGLKQKLVRLHAVSERSGISVAALCLGFSLLSPGIDQVLIGVDGLADLESNIAAAVGKEGVKKLYDDLCGLREDDETLILPFKWKK